MSTLCFQVFIISCFSILFLLVQSEILPVALSAVVLYTVHHTFLGLPVKSFILISKNAVLTTSHKYKVGHPPPPKLVVYVSMC